MRSLVELKRAVSEAIDAHADEITDIARKVLEHPETGFREFDTAKLAANVLRSLDLPVQEGIALTGLRAELKTGRPGPKAALLGEMDSLIIPNAPEADKVTGAFHGCGHHTHITSMLGAAIGLCTAKAQEELSGSVVFMAVPGEECIELEYRKGLMAEGKIRAFSGKPAMIRAGAFDDVDMAVMIHSGGEFSAMDANAFILKQVRFCGKECHAASPHGGNNALDAANVALHALGLMRAAISASDPRSRVHGIITKGGEAINVTPDDVRMEYQIRASSLQSLKNISAIFDRAMEGGAHSVGCSVEIETIPGDHAMHNDRDMYQLYRSIAAEIYPGRTIDDYISPEPGSTDMGDVSAIMPVIHPFAPGAAGHVHGADFHVPDLKGTCVCMSKMMAFLAVELLYGNAEKGRMYAARKKDCLTIAQYIAEIDSMKG